MRFFVLFVGLLILGCASAKIPGISLSGKPFLPSPGYETHVINGEDAEEGKYPYMLSLNYVKKKRHTCGASVLTKNYALTAAHCCEPMESEDMYIFAGSTSLSSPSGTEHRIESYVIHPLYEPILKWIYDACVIKVKDPFKLGEKVQQVTLPPVDWPINEGDLLNVTGWGITSIASDETPDKLQLGKNYRALSPENCKKMVNLAPKPYLCVVGGKNQGVCSGDSGSPIVKGQVQVGIASWVLMPCGGAMPDIYVRVPSIVDWIEKTVGEDAKDLKKLE